MTDLVQYQPQTDLTAQMDYARAVSTGSLLPQAYRGKPADILIAVGLGQAMGLSPAESLYRIDVIQGKPTASAELIAANVRKAGHKLRVRGDDNTCTATIVRADDPDFEFTITRDTAWAQKMGLTTKDNYKKQPGTMLQWRAISAVARLACPEALYGVAYTPDEMTDMRPATQQTTKASAADFATPATAPAPALDEQLIGHRFDENPEPVEAEVIPDVPLMTARTRGQLFALLADKGVNDRDEQIRGIVHIIGRPIESRSEITEDEAKAVIARLKP